jgi:hypothetical protein
MRMVRGKDEFDFPHLREYDFLSFSCPFNLKDEAFLAEFEFCKLLF